MFQYRTMYCYPFSRESTLMLSSNFHLYYFSGHGICTGFCLVHGMLLHEHPLRAQLHCYHTSECKTILYISTSIYFIFVLPVSACQIVICFCRMHGCQALASASYRTLLYRKLLFWEERQVHYTSLNQMYITQHKLEILFLCFMDDFRRS